MNSRYWTVATFVTRTLFGNARRTSRPILCKALSAASVRSARPARSTLCRTGLAKYTVIARTMPVMTIATTSSISVTPRARSGRVRRISQSVALKAHGDAGGMGDRHGDPQRVVDVGNRGQLGAAADRGDRHCNSVVRQRSQVRSVGGPDHDIGAGWRAGSHAESAVVADVVVARRAAVARLAGRWHDALDGRAAGRGCRGVDRRIVRVAVGEGLQLDFLEQSRGDRERLLAHHRVDARSGELVEERDRAGDAD